MYSSEETPEALYNNSSLSGLKEHVKKVMIPLLIKIFELKLAAQQAKTPPSRLQTKINEPPEDIKDQLLKLAEDLKLLQLWCQSCQNQIQKTLNETDEKQDPSFKTSASSEIPTHPGVEKSFSEAMTAQSIRYKIHSAASLKEHPEKEKSQIHIKAAHFLSKMFPWR